MKSLLYILPLFIFMSCDRTVKSEKGAIDVISNVYYNASKGLEEHQQFFISKINYINDDIVEIVPDVFTPEITDSIYYITDTVYYNSHDVMNPKSLVFRELKLNREPNTIYKKQKGAVWVNQPISLYDKRKDIADTTLYGSKSFKRFEIHSEDNYAVFYVNKTDTILPYSLNRIADKDYKGRIERIDSYNKKDDIFTTIWLIPREELDKEALEIFDFNQYVEKRFAEKTKELNEK